MFLSPVARRALTTRKVINRAHLATGFGRLRLHGDSALSDAWVYPFTFPTKTPVFVEA